MSTQIDPEAIIYHCAIRAKEQFEEGRKKEEEKARKKAEKEAKKESQNENKKTAEKAESEET